MLMEVQQTEHVTGEKQYIISLEIFRPIPHGLIKLADQLSSEC